MRRGVELVRAAADRLGASTWVKDPDATVKLSSLEAIVSALGEAEVRYLIVDGLAVAAHGHGRVTFDLDLVVQLEDANLRCALDAFGSLGYMPVPPVSVEELTDPERRRRWVEEENMVVFSMRGDRHRETPLDICVEEPFDFDHEFDRAMIGEIGSGLEARLVCPETLIRMKEAAGCAKDLEDARQLRLRLEDS